MQKGAFGAFGAPGWPIDEELVFKLFPLVVHMSPL